MVCECDMLGGEVLSQCADVCESSAYRNMAMRCDVFLPSLAHECRCDTMVEVDGGATKCELTHSWTAQRMKDEGCYRTGGGDQSSSESTQV